MAAFTAGSNWHALLRPGDKRYLICGDATFETVARIFGVARYHPVNRTALQLCGLKSTKEIMMRKFLLAAAALAALGTIGTSVPASAAEFQYCLQGRGVGYPGDCQYRSFAECQATASGRALSCGFNPRFVYAQRRPFRYWN